MREYVMEAIVLATRSKGEKDRVVDLFTKELGRFDARVIGGQKFLSKFSPHLDLGNFVIARLVRKNTFTLTDVISKPQSKTRSNLKQFSSILQALFLVRALVPVLQPDLPLWYFLKALPKPKLNVLKDLLSILGYNPERAICEKCKSENISHFLPREQGFLCKTCSRKFPENTVLCIKSEI